ncbi:MAG TPA: hypothetical protein VF635_11255 [Propionibacteriaceae bacterium]
MELGWLAHERVEGSSDLRCECGSGGVAVVLAVPKIDDEPLSLVKVDDDAAEVSGLGAVDGVDVGEAVVGGCEGGGVVGVEAGDGVHDDFSPG